MNYWFAVLGLMVGCSSEPTSEAGRSPTGAASPGQITIAFQGQGDGEIAPCGCPQNPMGGLTRRNLILEQLQAEGPVVVVESGNSLLPARMDPKEAEQRKVKVDLIAAAYQETGLDAMALGAQDWQLGIDALNAVIEKHLAGRRCKY